MVVITESCFIRGVINTFTPYGSEHALICSVGAVNVNLGAAQFVHKMWCLMAIEAAQEVMYANKQRAQNIEGIGYHNDI